MYIAHSYQSRKQVLWGEVYPIFSLRNEFSNRSKKEGGAGFLSMVDRDSRCRILIVVIA